MAETEVYRDVCEFVNSTQPHGVLAANRNAQTTEDTEEHSNLRMLDAELRTG